jgi:hypothetical protein
MCCISISESVSVIRPNSIASCSWKGVPLCWYILLEVKKVGNFMLCPLYHCHGIVVRHIMRHGQWKLLCKHHVRESEIKRWEQEEHSSKPTSSHRFPLATIIYLITLSLAVTRHCCMGAPTSEMDRVPFLRWTEARRIVQTISEVTRQRATTQHLFLSISQKYTDRLVAVTMIIVSIGHIWFMMWQNVLSDRMRLLLILQLF